MGLFSDDDFIIHSHTAHFARSALVHPVIVGGSHDAAGPEIQVLQPFPNPACKRYHFYPTLASNLLGHLSSGGSRSLLQCTQWGADEFYIDEVC